MKLILASASPRRRALLDSVDASYEVRVSHASEEADASVLPEDLPAFFAEKKAKTLPHAADEIVIAADTVVLADGKVLGKPKDEADALRMLSSLSGHTHAVLSGLCVLSDEKCAVRTVRTDVTFSDLSESEILHYVRTCRPLDKAGAYGIQEEAGAFVREIRGDYYNVVGLPLCTLREILRDDFGITLEGFRS